MYKTHQVRTTFGSCDVEKVHAVVVRSTFGSQKWRKKTKGFGALLDVRTRFLRGRHEGFCTLPKSGLCISTSTTLHPTTTTATTTTTTTTTTATATTTTLHYTILRQLHYTTLHSTPPHDKHSYNYNYSYNCITLHHTTLITLHYSAPYTTPHSTSLHYTTLNYTTVHYNYNYSYNYATLHQTTLHYPTLHCTTFTTPPQMQLQVHYTNYTTPQLQLHHTTTTTAALHHTTSSSCGWGDRPSDHCNHCNHSKIDSSNHLSVHQWIHSAICDSQQPSSHIGFLFWNFRHRLVRYYWYASQWMTCMAITYDQVGSLGNVEATFNAS